MAGSRGALPGRVVRYFDEHWDNWQTLRTTLVADASTGDARQTAGAAPVLLVDPTNAAAVLRLLCLPD